MLNEDEELRLEKILNTLHRGSHLSRESQLWLALKLQFLQVKLKRKISEEKSNRPEERNLINQAKQLMMNKYKCTEDEAHRFFIKAATDNRTTKFQIAKKFIEAETQ
jgi:AmiR/NasT family two-component response regulator